MTTIQDNVATPVVVVAQHASHTAKPIRVLTNVNLAEREQLLDLGFSVQAIDTASVAAFARLNQPAADKEGLTCGKLVLQNSRGFWNGTDLDLTAGEYRIIELLAFRPGQYFTYRVIYDRLRHQGFVSGRGPNGYRVNLRSAFKRIRNKFRAFDPTFQEIENHTGFGYRWRKPALGMWSAMERTTMAALAVAHPSPTRPRRWSPGPGVSLQVCRLWSRRRRGWRLRLPSVPPKVPLTWRARLPPQTSPGLLLIPRQASMLPRDSGEGTKCAITSA
jgi:hypothetical protein